LRIGVVDVVTSIQNEIGRRARRQSSHRKICNVIDQVSDPRLIVNDHSGIRVRHCRKEAFIPFNDKGKSGVPLASAERGAESSRRHAGTADPVLINRVIFEIL
jgi:hypothetical protein